MADYKLCKLTKYSKLVQMYFKQITDVDQHITDHITHHIITMADIVEDTKIQEVGMMQKYEVLSQLFQNTALKVKRIYKKT